MKKNAMLKIAAILMVAVLLTTCAISSTFAKYVTQGTANIDVARVAAFGYTLNTEISESGFAKSYVSDTDSYTGNTVYSASDFLVAPGTTGTLEFSGNLTATKTHEVAVKVSSVAEFTYTGFAEDYCPIVFTIGSTIYAHEAIAALIPNSTSYANTTALFDAVNAALSDEAIYAPGVTEVDGLEISDVFADKAVTWTWNFDLSGDIDKKDTELGNKDVAPTIDFSLTQSITQID